MDAELVGLHQDTSLVLGKHSGRHAFRSRLQVSNIPFHEPFQEPLQEFFSTEIFTTCVVCFTGKGRKYLLRGLFYGKWPVRASLFRER